MNDQLVVNEERPVIITDLRIWLVRSWILNSKWRWIYWKFKRRKGRRNKTISMWKLKQTRANNNELTISISWPCTDKCNGAQARVWSHPTSPSRECDLASEKRRHQTTQHSLTGILRKKCVHSYNVSMNTICTFFQSLKILTIPISKLFLKMCNMYVLFYSKELQLSKFKIQIRKYDHKKYKIFKA